MSRFLTYRLTHSQWELSLWEGYFGEFRFHQTSNNCEPNSLLSGGESFPCVKGEWH